MFPLPGENASWIIVFIRAYMICTFIDLDIIIFTKMAMQHRKLTEQEANKLFQTTFLLISQQNLAEKQKYLKNKSTPHSLPQHLSYLSPKKTEPADHKSTTPELAPLSFVNDPEKLQEKVMQKTSHKFSTDKEESFNEGNEVFLSSPSCLNDRDQISNDLCAQVMSPQKAPQKISQEMQPQMPQAQSQIKQDLPSNHYLQSFIKQLKRDLEIRSRGKICKSQEINSKTGQVTGFNFFCKNDINCPFNCSLQYTGQRNAKNEKLYKLVVKCESHHKACIEEEEEIIFMRLTKVIDGMEKPILRLLSQNSELKPKEILTTMAERLCQNNHKFIYKGLTSKSYHKAAKKYFDNLIYKVKNQMGAI